MMAVHLFTLRACTGIGCRIERILTSLQVHVSKARPHHTVESVCKLFS